MRSELLRPLVVALAACAALSACSSAGGGRYPINLDVPAVITTPVPDNPPPHGFDLESGAQVFMARCASCHGPLGLGNGAGAVAIRGQGKRVANLVEKAPAATPESWYRLIGKGNLENLMPGFGGLLTVQERWDVTQYALSLGRQPLDSGDGALAIRVANQTPGGSAAAGLTVTLHAYVGPGEAFSRTARADEQGNVAFRGLAVRDNLFYQAETTWRGARFFSAPQQITRTAQSAIVPLPIFEVTTDPAAISLAGYQFVVDGVDEGKISVIEAYAFQNSADRAYIAPDATAGAPRSVSIAYPAGAQNLRFDGAGIGERFVRDGDLLRDMDAILPGSRAEIILFYDLPYRGSARIERKMTAPLQRWEAILPDSELRAVGLQDLGAQAIPGLQTAMRRFAPAAPSPVIRAGQSVTIELAGQPRAASLAGLDARAVGVGFILFAVAMAAAYVLLLRARAAAPAPTRQTLLASIAALDTALAQGKVSPADHSRRRARLKRELLEVWVEGRL
ncbi:MAG: cytochrome c [Thermoflexales bacterium]